MVGEIISES